MLSPYIRIGISKSFFNCSHFQEMRAGVQDFVTSLLDHVRTSTELEVMLNFNHEPSNEIWTPGKRQTLERLKLAIRFKQKTVYINYFEKKQNYNTEPTNILSRKRFFLLGSKQLLRGDKVSSSISKEKNNK